jgi:hypothetical protein
MTEPFVRTMNNYEDRVTMVPIWGMMSINNSKLKFTTSEKWENFTEIYYFLNGLKDFEDDNFSWMSKDVKQLTTGKLSKKEISFAIFKYIRDNFSCTSHGDYFLSQKLKETFNNKSGNVADLNLLLIAMLRHMHIDAFPAILATVDKGMANLSYPLPGDFNYLICVANVDGEEVLMDASEPLNPYGKIPAYCYNGGAVTLHSKKSKLISLTADSLMEQYRANVILGIDEKGLVSGNFTLNCGPLLSYELRKKLRNISLDKYLKEKVKDQVDHFSNEEAQELKNPDEPLIISSDIDFVNSSKSNLLYINPVIFPYMDKNPFIEVNRKYAIEMPSRIDNVYLLSLDIPKGYVVDEIPASAKIVLRDNDGYFEYLMEKNEDNIQFRMRMKINKTFFSTNEYKDLREFYSQIVKKESEQIVFRKLK